MLFQCVGNILEQDLSHCGDEVRETAGLPLILGGLGLRSAERVRVPAYWVDGPASSRGRHAGFLVHSSVSSAAIPGVVDSVSVRWRVFAGAVCVCSFHAPHAGIGEVDRVQFWQELVDDGSAHGSCWRPHFHLGRDLLLSFCDLVLCNPADRPTQNAGAVLDVVFVSSIRPARFRVHDG